MSQSFSKGSDLGVKNINAILEFSDWTGGVFKISLNTTCDTISSSVNSFAGAGGSQLVRVLQPLEEKM